MNHGGNIYEIASAYHLAKDQIIDFSANINPFGVPETMKSIILDGLASLAHYPDIHNRELIHVIAKRYQLKTDHLYVGNGGAQVITDFIRCVSPVKTLVVCPTFIEYERALHSVGSQIELFYLREEDNFQLDVDRLIKALDLSFELVVICNPNNPTSTLVSKPDLVKLLQVCQTNRTYLMVDEAFMDFIDPHYEHSLMPLCNEYSYLLVTRSFTKFYGVPGLRLGFGVLKNPVLRDRLARATVPWSLNYFASRFGRVLEEEEAYEQATYQWLEAEKERFYQEVRGIEGIKAFPPQVNYMLLKITHPELNGAGLKQALLKKKLLIREAGTFHGLTDQFVRIAIKNQDLNHILADALNEVLSFSV